MGLENLATGGTGGLRNLSTGGTGGLVNLQEVGDIPDSAQDLVAWYRFEGGDARDYASNAEYPNVTWGDSTAYDGTVNGATYQSSGGVTDFENGGNSGAFDFDGTDDFIDLPTTGLPTGQSSVTLSCWVKITGNIVTDFDHILNYGSGATSNTDGGSFGMMIEDTQSFYFYGFGSSIDYDTGASFQQDVWSHIVAAYDGSVVRTFFNGEETPTSNQPRSLNIGSDRFAVAIREDVEAPTPAVIDDVRVYNRALSSSEVSDIYNATKP